MELGMGEGMPPAPTGMGMPPTLGMGMPPGMMGPGMAPGMMGPGMAPGMMGPGMAPGVAPAPGGAVAGIGVSSDGRCVALPNLSVGTVTTVKDAGNQLLIGVWRITGQQPSPGGGIAVSVELPGMIVAGKTTGRCMSRRAGLSLTFRGANLGEVLTEAAEAWCRTV